MNERIQELAEQAWNETAVSPDFGHPVTFAERFSKMIIKECLTQVDKIRDGCEQDGEDEQALGADWAALAIARHFGVE